MHTKIVHTEQPAIRLRHMEEKFGCLTVPKKGRARTQGEEEEPMGDIADYEEGDDGLSGEVPNYNEEEVEYIDFLGVENILNSPNNDLDEFYADEENYMSQGK
jgi:hypothetical protein